MNPRLRLALVFALAVLSFLAPLKFNVPVILYYLDTPLTHWMEWLLCGWPSIVFYLILAPIAVAGLGAGRWSHRETRLFLWPGLFLVVQALASAWGVNMEASHYVLWLFIALAAGYLVGARTIQTVRDRRWISWAWVLAALLIALSGISQATGGLEKSRRLLKEQYPETEHTHPDYWKKVHSDRIFSMFVGPNAFGGYIAAAVFMVAAWGAGSWKAAQRGGDGRTSAKRAPPSSAAVTGSSMAGILILSGGIILALLYCLWKTQSKGGYAALFLALVAGVALLAPRRRAALVAIAAVCVFAVAAFAVGYGHSAVEKGHRTMDARFGYWRAAWQIGCDHPLLGTGPGTFSRMYMSYQRSTDEATRLAHNNYLQMWCDSGILGFVAFVAWLPGSMILWLRRWRRVPPSERLVPTLWWCACLAFALHSLVDFDLYMIGNSWPIFVLLGHLAAGRPEDAVSSG